MTFRLLSGLVLLLIHISLVNGQAAAPPFASLERAVKEQRGGWAGDKSKLSAVFAAERRQLGDKFEAELLKWIGKDVERHYWISSFLESDSYLHGNKRLPYLALLIKEQGLSLIRDKDDAESQGDVVRMSITAAALSAELGLSTLAISYKNQAETLLKSNSDLSGYVPAMNEDDRRRYDNIASAVARPTVIADSNPPPKARLSGGILNSRAIKLVKPAFPAAAHQAGAAGEVTVQIVFDEQGKVIWARAISGHPLLRSACEDAAWQSTFPPTKVSGQPVKVTGVLIYNFVP
jgi:hypothetical protein